MSTVCWKCGAEVPEGSAACQKCGAAVTGSVAAVPASPFAPSSSPFSSGSSPFSSGQGQGQGYSSPPPPPAPSAPPAYTPMQSSAPPAGYSPVAMAAPTAQPGFAPVQSGFSPPPPPPGVQPMGAAPMPARSGGSSAVKIVLIIIAIIVGLGILGVGAIGFTIWRVAHAVKVATTSNGNGQVTVHTAGGTFSANTAKTYTADELGVDIYPGATATQGGARLEMPSGSWVTGVFLTSDSKDQVVAFYKDKLGSDATSMDTGDTAIVTMKKGEKEAITVTISQKPNEDQGKTKFAVMHTKAKS